MTQMPQRLRHIPKILVALIWSIAGFSFISMINPVLISQLALLPDGFAKVTIGGMSSPGIMILCGMLFGLMSVWLWQRSSNSFITIGLSILIPILLFCGTFSYGMSDTQGVMRHITQAAQSGDLKTTREQVLIQSHTPSQSKALIQLGANVNARDPGGRSALYSASWEGRDPELIKILLEAGAKPDAIALRHAIMWGRLDAIKLMFGATSDDGKALIAELGNDALQANNVHTRTPEADRAQITQMLIARGAKSNNNP
jgi:uncharacterized protein